MLPPGHIIPPQLEPQQITPGGQTIPQLPQWPGLLLMSTHTPPQHVGGALLSPGGHAFPQPPQSFGSPSVSLHTPPQQAFPRGQQVPLQQTPDAQTLPQLP